MFVVGHISPVGCIRRIPRILHAILHLEDAENALRR
jgi:hypothetical protein